jgi:hypothetical protein
MKLTAQHTCSSRIFEWFLEGQNTAIFLRLSVIFNFVFSAFPVASLAWFTMPIESQPLLTKIRTQHPEVILTSIRDNYVFLICVLACVIIVTVEIVCCLKINRSTLKVCLFIR